MERTVPMVLVLSIALTGCSSQGDQQFAAHPASAAEAAARGQPATSRTPAQSSVVVRRVWADAPDFSGSPSPDGRYLSFVDWSTGDLVIRDLVAGENRRLTNKGSWYESSDYALGGGVFSPDGRALAYGWYNQRDSVFELRIIDVDGSRFRTVYKNANHVTQPAAWSPDGKQILVKLAAKDGSHTITLISAQDGWVRVLKSLDWRAPAKMAFSSDGRFIAYDFPPDEGSPSRDIFVLAADGSTERRVTKTPANERLMGWSPAGSGLFFFVSEQDGSDRIWRLGIAEGKPDGDPEAVPVEVWRMRPIGFSLNGYFYGVQIGGEDLYTATLDVERGRVLSGPTLISQSRRGPAWSPDGSQLAYTRLEEIDLKNP